MTEEQRQQQREMVEEIRNRVLKWKSFHDEHCQDHDPCKAKYSLIAFLAHTIGIMANHEDLSAFVHELEEYERNCPQCQQSQAHHFPGPSAN